jgi:hypothetical protein
MKAGKKLKAMKKKRRLDVCVDLASILSIDHACRGCAKPETCCCARYEVCVETAELNHIIQVMPEAAKFCPHLKTANGYDNVFEQVEPGLYAIDTNEEGLCVFAFMSGGHIRCSLHAAGLKLELPLARVKPKACLLWPLSFSDGDSFLSLAKDALHFKCNSPRRNLSRHISPALSEAIGLVYGTDFRVQIERKAAKKLRRATIALHG